MSSGEENGVVGVGVGGSPLDLNNLPEDFTRDGKQPSEDTSSSGSVQRRKKGMNGNDESGKVYECRFCSLKFCKSQALGGHMNRHRQERETESLNKARQLVFGTENVATYGALTPPHHHHHHHQHQHHLGGGGFQHQHQHQQAPLMYPTRMFRSPTTPQLAHQQQSHIYPIVSYPSQYHHDYESSSNYTCIGAPVSVSGPAGGFMLNSSGTSAGRGYDRMESTSASPPANRFQHTPGF